MVAVVFGARGNVGRHVAAGLRAAGEQVRVTSRTPGPAGLPEGMQVAIADLEQPESLTGALEGAGKIFLYAKPRGIQGFVNAALAVAALTESGHEQQAYLVYGPQSLTLREMTSHIGDAIGHEIGLERVPVDQARAELGQTMPPGVVDNLLRRWASGEPAAVSSIVRDVTGHPARTFAQWAKDHVDDFR